MVEAGAPVLELRRSELMTLAALSDPEISIDSIDRNDLERLRAIGAVEGMALNAGIVPIAEAVRSPLVRLRLDFLGPAQPVVCPGWMDSRFAVLAVPRSGGVEDVKVAPTGFLPARLAGFTGLGPRPLNDWSWDGDRSELDTLLSDLRQHWRVTTTWNGGSRSLEVLDGGHAGLWVVRENDDHSSTSVRPTTATEVWISLIETLPRSDEMVEQPAEVT